MRVIHNLSFTENFLEYEIKNVMLNRQDDEHVNAIS